MSTYITRLFLLGLFGLVIYPPSVLGQQMTDMKSDTTVVKNNSMKKMDSSIDSDEEEVAHPFLNHMGMPEAVGMYSLRLSALTTQEEGISKADFGIHFETGLSDFIGLHIRNDRVLENDHTEIMFQFAALKSKNGMNGVSAIIEFEIPTHEGVSRIETLVGFSSTLSNAHLAFNQSLHYSPYENLVEGGAALVYRVNKIIYLAVETQGEKGPDEKVIFNLLGGIKIRINQNLLIGLAYHAPISENRDFTSQYILQPDLLFMKK